MSMTFDFTYDQGSNDPVTFVLSQGDGTPFDLSGADVYMQARKDFESKVELEATVGNGLTVVGSTITFQPSPAVTSAIRFGRVKDGRLVGQNEPTLDLVYDIEIVKDGRVTKPVRGVITLNRESTRVLFAGTTVYVDVGYVEPGYIN